MAERPDGAVAAEQSIDLFRLLIESVRDYAIFHLDLEGRVQSWNEGARRIKGYEADEIIGKHFSIFYPPQEVRRGKPAYELAVASDDGQWEEEGWRLRKDGTRFWANVVITALRGPDGEIVGFAKVTRDLTERKLAEEQRSLMLERERRAREEAERAVGELEALQRMTETAFNRLDLSEVVDDLLERILEFLEVDVAIAMMLDEDPNVLLPIGIVGVDATVDQMIEVPVGGGFSGRIAESLQSLSIRDASEHEIWDPLLRQVGISALLGVPLVTGDHALGVLLVGAFYNRNFAANEERFLQVVADRVSIAIERSRLIESEQQARVEAELADARLRAQDAFLAMAAHELRSPTAAVKTAVQLLGRRLTTQPDEDPRKWLAVIEAADQQADRLTRLVDKLIESVRIDAGQMGLEPEDTDVVALISQAVDLASVSTGPEAFHLVAPDELHAEIDPLRFEEVVTNLLENAIKFSNGEVVDIHINQPDSTHWRLAVRDRGIGVPVRHRPHVFDRFYQAPNGHVERGLGLGLYISREIVTAHGGEIHAEFPDDGGTCFVVTMPVG